MEFNLQGRVLLSFDEAPAWRDEWRGSLGDVDGAALTPPAPQALTIILRQVAQLPREGLREIETGVFGRPGCVVDTKYGVRLEAVGERTLRLDSRHLCIEWLSWLLQVGLLASGATLVHGAAVAKDGRALVTPSWGGVGKTGLVAHLVRALDWRLLGDDFVILTPEGQCFAFPKPMVVYPYHASIFPELFATGGGPAAPTALNGTLSRAAVGVKAALRPFPALLRLARRHNPQSVRVNPSRVFGPDGLAAEGQLGALVWLDRVEGLNEPEILPADDRFAARLLGSTLTQFDPWCVHVTNLGLGLGLLPGEPLYAAWGRVLDQMLAQSPLTRLLHLPADLPVASLHEALGRVVSLGDNWGPARPGDGSP